LPVDPYRRKKGSRWSPVAEGRGTHTGRADGNMFARTFASGRKKKRGVSGLLRRLLKVRRKKPGSTTEGGEEGGNPAAASFDEKKKKKKPLKTHVFSTGRTKEKK